MAFKKINTQTDLENASKELTDNLHTKLQSLEFSRAEKIINWLSVWSEKYLDWELTFSPERLKHYKRGEAVHVHFGHNIGDELNGPHYAIIIEDNNGNKQGTVVVAPLRSLKPNEDENNLDNHEVFLGYGIFEDDIKRVEEQIKANLRQVEEATGRNAPRELVTQLQKKISADEKFLRELKRGSVVKLSQIKAISKLRIITPRNSSDPFATYQLKGPKLQELNDKLRNYFI